ncbi:hypothetical protein GW915_02450 [bacterium]|nr:hypothetical protein [bacterium]
MKSEISPFRVAIVQMRSTQDPWENLLTMKDFIDQAIGANCQLICFPENCCYRGPKRSDVFDRKELFLKIKKGKIEENSEFSSSFVEMLKHCPIAVSFGSVFECSDELERPFNTHLFYRPGMDLVSYRKIHLFNFVGSDASYRESDDFKAGQSVVCADFLDWKFGLSICYDLRFPETYRKMVLEQGAQVLLAPAAFTMQTGKAHWSLLNRARAVENLSYVVSSTQWGEHSNAKGLTFECFGHALAIDPWGQVLDELSEVGDSFITVELFKDKLIQIRRNLPSLNSVPTI